MTPKKSGKEARGKSQAITTQASKKVSASALEWQKRLKGQYSKYRALQHRESVVEQARRAVYAYLLEITHENIELAKQGNCSAAKFLTKLAGIDEMPARVAAMSKGKKQADGDDDPNKAVAAFYHKLGITPPRLKPPVPVMAAAEEAGTLV